MKAFQLVASLMEVCIHLPALQTFFLAANFVKPSTEVEQQIVLAHFGVP